MESQDEIEQIMNEIEELQQEMNSAAMPKTTQSSPPAHPQSASSTVSGQASEIKADLEPELTSQAAGISDSEVDQDILKDFSGDGDEPWLEETLATLKDSKSEGGGGMLGDLNTSNEPSQDELEKELAAEREAVEKMIQEESEAAAQVEKEVRTDPPAQRSRSQSPSDGLSMSSPSQEAGQGQGQVLGSSLGLSIEGQMTLKLNYASNSRQMTIQFSHQFIVIQLADGTEVKLPIH
jgi:peptidoglycan hydrolase CwlO-like protein